MTLPLPDDFGLYLVLTHPRAGYAACAEAAVAEGVRFLQLRMKGEPRAAVLRIARELRKITAGSPTRFIVNDDVELAAESEADGVHLGQSDLSLDEARRRWPVPGRIFGLSTHNEQQVRAAAAAAPDYIGIGPIFPTPTKTPPDPTVGLEGLRRLLPLAPAPAVAIGGIDESNLQRVRDAGARNFAVVRAVCAAEDPRQAVRRLLELWRDVRRP